MTQKKGVFLSAAWRKLILANYPVDPELLFPYVPKGTELDLFEDTCYISLVGFMFLNTKIMGYTIPFHKDFEEFNLRFYVKRETPEGIKRAVVFIKEIVPKPAIAWTAKTIYREPYVTMPMKHEIITDGDQLRVGYYFQHNNFWNKISVVAENTQTAFAKGSIEDFITEHYWGYNKYSEEITMEYEVEHPSWTTYPVKDFSVQIKYEEIYGEKFARALEGRPLSVILAEGSDVIVRKGSKIII